MDQDIAIKIEGLKLVSKVGLPKPLEKGFRSDNGYGGEIWQPDFFPRRV